MTPAFSARGRADEFEALLSRGPDTPLTERESARYADLLEVVSELHALPEVAPRAEFTASLRERLMAEADTVLVQQPAAPRRLAMPTTSRSGRRRIGAVLGGAALVGAAATLAVASQTALPGESLYDVKRGIESAEVRFAPDDAARGRTLLAQAGTRLSEVEELAAGEAGRDELIPATLDSFTRQSNEGVRSMLAAYESSGSDTDAQAARDFTAQSMQRLDDLQTQLPESAREAFLTAGRTLSDLDLEVSSVCVACSGGITEVPDFLLTSAPEDLLTGLDVDAVQLEPAPISGQDLTGITVPQALSPEQVLPSTDPTNPTKGPTPGLPTPTGVLPTQTPTQPVKPDPTKPVKDITQDVTDTVDETVTTTVNGVTDLTGDLASQLNGVTGGALGGLTSGVDDATGGLIGEVTGTLDGATGGLLGNATGGLLPGGK